MIAEFMERFTTEQVAKKHPTVQRVSECVQTSIAASP